MKRAFLVYGPEASACRFVTSAFIAAGCDGDAGHVQRFDRGFQNGGEIVVWRRSFPHAFKWSSIAGMVKTLRENGYVQASVIVTVRDHHAMLASQLRARRVRSRDQGERNILEAYSRIFSETRELKLPMRLAVYESFLRDPAALDRLLESFDLKLIKPIQIVDGNSKYFQPPKSAAGAGKNQESRSSTDAKTS